MKKPEKPKGKAGGDAPGRKPRPERELIEHWKKRRRPVVMVGDQCLLEWAVIQLAAALRGWTGLSKKGMAEVCAIERATVQNAEGGVRNRSIATMDYYCCGLNLTYCELGWLLDQLAAHAPLA